MLNRIWLHLWSVIGIILSAFEIGRYLSDIGFNNDDVGLGCALYVFLLLIISAILSG